METPTSKRLQAYQNLSEPLANLYGSPESGETLSLIFKKFEYPQELYSVYVNAVGDTILGFFKIADLPRVFQQKLNISADESQRLTSQLVEFLAPVVSREEAEMRAKKESLGALAQTFASPSPESIATPVAPEFTSNVEPLRTMEKDISRIHGYGAYVEAEEKEDKEKPAEIDMDAPLAHHKQNPTFND